MSRVGARRAGLIVSELAECGGLSATDLQLAMPPEDRPAYCSPGTVYLLLRGLRAEGVVTDRRPVYGEGYAAIWALRPDAPARCDRYDLDVPRPVVRREWWTVNGGTKAHRVTVSERVGSLGETLFRVAAPCGMRGVGGPEADNAAAPACRKCEAAVGRRS